MDLDVAPIDIESRCVQLQPVVQQIGTHTQLVVDQRVAGVGSRHGIRRGGRRNVRAAEPVSLRHETIGHEVVTRGPGDRSLGIEATGLLLAECIGREPAAAGRQNVEAAGFCFAVQPFVEQAAAERRLPFVAEMIGELAERGFFTTFGWDVGIEPDIVRCRKGADAGAEDRAVHRFD